MTIFPSGEIIFFHDLSRGEIIVNIFHVGKLIVTILPRVEIIVMVFPRERLL